MFQLSRSFCILPFLHHHLNPQGKMTPCCLNEEVMGDVLQESMEEIFEGEGFRKIRETFLKGEFPESCASCENLEKQGTSSMRQGVNLRFKKDVLSMSMMTDPSGRLPYYKPKSLDIRFSNICNFKCRSCGPNSSSAWAKEENRDPINSLPKHILEDVLKIIPQVEEVYFAGGEPLLIRENLAVIEEVKKTNLSTRIIYNTNLTSLNFHGVDYLEVWKDLKDLLIIVSLDDLGAKGEYLRSGLNFSEFLHNAKKLQKAGIEFRFNCVVSAINVFSLGEMSAFLAKEFPHIEIEFILLQTPTHLRISVFPPEIHSQLRQFLKDLAVNTSNLSLQSLIKRALLELEQDQFEHFEELINVIKLIDARRGESFCKVYATHPMGSYF